MAITPLRKGAACASAGCARDLNGVCPAGLAVKSGSDGRVVGCKSACFAFRSDRFCCTGKFGSPQECKPTAYSRLFKEACPRAYSYAYDDPTSILTCSGASYLVTFCPRSWEGRYWEVILGFSLLSFLSELPWLRFSTLFSFIFPFWVALLSLVIRSSRDWDCRSVDISASDQSDLSANQLQTITPRSINQWTIIMPKTFDRIPGDF